MKRYSRPILFALIAALLLAGCTQEQTSGACCVGPVLAVVLLAFAGGLR